MESNHSEAFSSRLQEITLLTAVPLQDLEQNQLVALVKALSHELLAYRDLLCDAATAARILGRKRSWIYDAVSRPSTDIQRGVAMLAAREGTSLVFRVSDLVRLRRELFEPDFTSACESDVTDWLKSLSNRSDGTCHCGRRSL